MNIPTLPELLTLTEENVFPSEHFQIPNVTLSNAEEHNYSNIRFGYGFDTNLYIFADIEVSMSDSLKRMSGDIPELKIDFDGKEIPNFFNKVVSGKNKFSFNGPEEIHKQTYRFVVKRSPYLFEFGNETRSIKLFAINILQTSIFGRDETIDTEDAKLTISSIRDNPNIDSGRYQPTHELVLHSKAIDPMSAEEVSKELFLIHNFLLLVSGQTPGIGHLIGETETGNPSVFIAGFTASGKPRAGYNGWYKPSPNVKLEKVYSGFRDLSKKTQDYEVVRRVLQYYRAANSLELIAREVGLVASCSGIEALMGRLLTSRAGWTKNLIKTSHLSDRMAAAAALIGLDKIAMDHCPHLEKRLNREKKTTYRILAKFRNGLVHSDPDFKYEPFELIESFNTFQWFLEILLLSMLGYTGEMQDRRQYSGFSKTVPVPYKRLQS
ncbi:MAG: hypothetical protein ACSHX3_11115 [Litorimonas sp.]